MSKALLLGNVWCADTPGGLDRYLAELLTALRRCGHPAVAVALGPNRAENTRAPEGVVVAAPVASPLPARLWRFDRAVRRAKAGADVVDSHFALSTFFPLVSGGLRRLPLVVHFQGPWADESILAHGDGAFVAAIKRHVERAVYRRAGEIVTLSAAFKRIAVERYGLPPWRITVSPPGVDLERFRPAAPDDRASIRSRLGVDPGTTLALCVRRLDPRMGVEVLIDAWTRTATDHVLIVAGHGEPAFLERLRQRAIINDVGSRVRFLGGVSEDQLVELYQAADLSVVPSVALEGFGLVVLESLACGTPVVATDVGGLPEALAGLDPTLIVAAGDPSALAARIRAAASPRGSLPGRQACRLHAERFSWEKVADETLKVYSRAVNPPPARPLRVVYVDHCAQLSGAEIALLRTLPALSGVDAHVVLAEDGPLTRQLAVHGLSAEVLEMPDAARSLRRHRVRATAGTLSAARQALVHTVRLALRLRRLRPDLVHTNSLKAALYGGVAARLARVPVVWHLHDRIADDYLPGPAVRLVRTLARRLPAAIIANSEATASTVDVGSRQVAVVPTPVDPALLARKIQAAVPVHIGIVGRLAPWKGQHVFIEAFAKAFPDGEERAVIVGAALFGEDDYEADLRRQVHALRLEDRVTFTGFETDVGSRLAQLSVLVHASVVPEPFGQVVAEGMAIGLPVVATAAGGPAEVITDGVDGLLYEPGDTEALAAALKRLAGDATLRHRLGVAARERARDLTPALVAARVNAVYEQALGDRWPPDVIRPGSAVPTGLHSGQDEGAWQGH